MPIKYKNQTQISTRGSIWQRPLPAIVTVITLLVIVVMVLWIAHAGRVGIIFSESMEPTLISGDRYIIRIDSYKTQTPRVGDIVVIKHPQQHELLVKRVLGVTGDQVGIFAGRVWLNGKWLEEPYLKPEEGVLERPLSIIVPEGELFLLGDNRNHSEDSRDIGTLPTKQVIGKVIAIIWPWDRRQKL